MSPLLLANWRTINRLFCSLLWLLAVILAIAILCNAAPSTPGPSRARTAIVVPR